MRTALTEDLETRGQRSLVSVRARGLELVDVPPQAGDAGRLLRPLQRLVRQRQPLPVLGAALASSLSFFVISNAAVWACWSMYPKNLGGLMMSYVAGLPFFRHALGRM